MILAKWLTLIQGDTVTYASWDQYHAAHSHRAGRQAQAGGPERDTPPPQLEGTCRIPKGTYLIAGIQAGS